MGWWDEEEEEDGGGGGREAAAAAAAAEDEEEVGWKRAEMESARESYSSSPPLEDWMLPLFAESIKERE